MKKPAIAHPVCDPRGSRNEACVVVVECEEDGVKASENVPLILATEKAASVMAQIMTVVPELQAGLTREVSSASVAGRRGTQRD